jgi:CCR4-NOT transcription complex subunit 6
MIEQAQPHYYARLKAAENKGIGYPSPASGKTATDNDTDDRRRPYSLDKARGPQAWHNLDMSGQGLRNLAPALFAYTFLNELYIASNKLTSLPSSIGQLRQLRHLEASHNLLTELPAELGMCTYLKELLLFHNRLTSLPHEIGSLHLLEQLGIDGNNALGEYQHEIAERGTKSLINMLKEASPSRYPAIYPRFPLLTIVLVQSPTRPSLASSSPCKRMCRLRWRGSRSSHGTCYATSTPLPRHTDTPRHRPSAGNTARIAS